jgi:minor histocompatibility antigen H13
MSSDSVNLTGATDVPGNGTQDALSTPVSLVEAIMAHWDFIYLTMQVTLSAMGIIWLGANSSLRRPPSAAPPKSDGKKKSKDDTFTDGFAASDAILFPLVAGTLLASLYYLIKWLQDPDLLNKILRTYMSIMSVASLGKLSADILHLLTSLVFPSIWMDRSGTLHEISSTRRKQMISGEDGPSVSNKKSPFPGLLSEVSFSSKTNDMAWEVRHLLKEEWTVNIAMYGLGSCEMNIKLNDLVGFCLALAITMVYYLTNWSSLSNLIGSSFSYAAFTVVSPTSFPIGTMVLAGLFVYDIVMVFYT